MTRSQNFRFVKNLFRRGVVLFFRCDGRGGRRFVSLHMSLLTEASSCCRQKVSRSGVERLHFRVVSVCSVTRAVSLACSCGGIAVGCRSQQHHFGRDAVGRIVLGGLAWWRAPKICWRSPWNSHTGIDVSLLSARFHTKNARRYRCTVAS